MTEDAEAAEALSFWENDGPPSHEDIAGENRAMPPRQKNFREAAGYVASAFATLAEVEKVVLFSSLEPGRVALLYERGGHAACRPQRGEGPS